MGSVNIRTYNCNGLGDLNKFRRLLIKVGMNLKKCGIILLQETHIKDENIIKTYWKNNYVSSCVSTQRGGVLTTL